MEQNLLLPTRLSHTKATASRRQSRGKANNMVMLRPLCKTLN